MSDVIFTAKYPGAWPTRYKVYVDPNTGNADLVFPVQMTIKQAWRRVYREQLLAAYDATYPYIPLHIVKSP